MARTVTAVGALESATDRSSQLGQRMTDSMAAARWALVGGVDEKTPLPDQQGHDQHHTEQRPQGEPTGPHAPDALARAMSPSSSAAVTGDTM